MTNSADILRAARAMIADPKHWTKNEFARDFEGDGVNPEDPNAVCWCARGAIAAAASISQAEDPVATAFVALRPLRDAIQERTGERNIPHFNDDHEHVDVLAAFDRAIQLAEGRP